MLISMNWISDFVDLQGEDIEALIHRFTLSTAEVEEVLHKGRDTYGVIVARIASVENHPNSQKLHLLKVDTGNGLVDCVCGAPNVSVGMNVAFAKAGGSVGGNLIKEATVAGFPSCGMCCSAAELGISADHSGLLEIPEDVPLGTDVKALYPIDDIIFEVDNKSLTNRPDLWGHYGIAREFSALTGRPLKAVAVADCTAYDNLPAVEIVAEDKELLYRYIGVKIGNVTKKVAPMTMQIRLFYCGMRSINLLTDLTNYIMLELGQPMHAFDRRKVDSIEVRRFPEEVHFETLDGVKRTVTPEMLMICSKGTPVAVAGVMGGLDSEIEDDTDALLLESANFSGESIRKTSTRLGLRTDASMRYEKVLDPELTMTATGRFLYLLQEIDPDVTVLSKVTDCYVRRYDPITVDFDKAFVDRYTGIDIPTDRIVTTLTALGFTVRQTGNRFSVDVPSWRSTKDVTIQADIIEEITRIYGYDNFAITTTNSALTPVRSSVNRTDTYAVKDLLVDKFNLHEVHSYIWADSKVWGELGLPVAENVKLLNAINPNQIHLRTSMVPTLLSMVNANKLFAPSFGIFEIGKVIDGLRPDGTCNERKKLGIALFSRQDNEKTLYLRLRDMLAYLARDVKHTAFTFEACDAAQTWQHPTNTAAIRWNDLTLGTMSCLHPRNLNLLDKKAAVVFAEVDMELLNTVPCPPVHYVEPSKYPAIDVDLTFLTQPTVRYADLAQVWEAQQEPLLRNVSLVGVYEGEMNSVTVRLSFSSDERTLSRNEITPCVDRIVAALDQKGIHLKLQ